MENSISPTYVNGTNSNTPNSYISMGTKQRGQHITQEGEELANNNNKV